MAMAIDQQKCARCGSCESECLHQAVFQTEDAYVINSGLCNECAEKYGEQLCVAVCSSDAIQKVKVGFYKKLLG